MTDSPHIRSAVAQGLLELAPPLIRMSLLKDDQFRDEFGFKRDPVLAFDDSGSSIERSKLYGAIRQALSGKSASKVSDTEGRDWMLTVERGESQSVILEISHNRHQIQLLPHATLSPDKIIRLRTVDDISHSFNLPTSARNRWRKLTSERALYDDEVDEFYVDFCDTPIHIERSIHSEIRKGKGSASSLVPRSKRYYDRMVGAYDDSASISDYAVGRGRQFFEQLSAWRPYDGFLFSLLLSSHSALTAEISVEHLEREDLVRAFDFLEARGDRISQLGAIEIGLRVLPEIPEIQPAITRLIEQLRDDDVDGSESGFKLLSALFFLVDGELSKIRLLSAQPPFYRRLASLSQAALICRQFVDSGVAIDPFCDWVASSRGVDYWHFYFQSFVDMRLEPRWCPDFAVPTQIKANFLGRIIDVAMYFKEKIQGTELHDLVLGSGSDSLLSLIEFPGAFFPGPLEGGENISSPVPDFLSEAIEAQLRAEEVGLSSFVGLVNFAPICRIKSDQSELAAKVLKMGRYRLADIEEKSQLLTVLTGLASVAAVTRSRVLADELRILMRKYRREAQYTLSIEEAMRVYLAAAASRADLEEWKEYVGDCLTELAFGELEGDDRDMLHMYLQYLCHAVPELWGSCSRADAVLKALRGY